MIICHLTEPFLYLGLLFPWKLWRPVLAGAERLTKISKHIMLAMANKLANMKHK